jgi:hypothetical protein
MTDLKGTSERRIAFCIHILAGTPDSHEVAACALGLMKQWGLDAHIEEFEALLPTPKTRLLEMTAPKKFRAKLDEPPVPGIRLLTTRTSLFRREST